MATTHYTLTCLSPVHVGTGTALSKFDGAYEDGRWHVIDLDKLFARGVDGDELAQAMGSTAFAWAEWLRGRRMRAADVALYSLPCPKDPGEVAVREGMKDVYLQPYIPGSTLKGAIRTGILWYLLKNDARARDFVRRYLVLVAYAKDIAEQVREKARGDRRKERDPQVHRGALEEALELQDSSEVEAYLEALYRALGKNLKSASSGDGRSQINSRDIERLGGDKRYAALPVEQYVMGRDPNHDLMRMLHVIDTETVSLQQLEVGLVWTYTLRQNRLVEKRESSGEYKSFAEWLRAGSQLNARIDLEEFLLSETAKRALRFSDAGVKAIQQLAKSCNAYAATLIARQRDFFARYQLTALRNFFQELQQRLNSLPEGAFLLNIGWGGGWEAKTVGDIVHDLLQQGEFDDFTELRKKYKLGADPNSGRILEDAPFPKTRLVAYRNGAPCWMLGWVLLEPHKSS